MRSKVFTFKNCIVSIIVIWMGISIYQKISEEIAYQRFLNQYEETYEVREKEEQDRISKTEDELVRMYPAIEFEIGSGEIIATIPYSENYTNGDVKKLAENIAVIAGENNILSTEWNMIHDVPNNIKITYNHYLTNGVKVTHIYECESSRYWSNNGFHSKALLYKKNE